jgi:hypothetical protein
MHCAVFKALKTSLMDKKVKGTKPAGTQLGLIKRDKKPYWRKL